MAGYYNPHLVHLVRRTSLPACQRRAVELIYLEGQQVKTTAAVLGRTRQTVGFHRNDALTTLRHNLHHTRAS